MLKRAQPKNPACGRTTIIKVVLTTAIFATGDIMVVDTIFKITQSFASFKCLHRLVSVPGVLKYKTTHVFHDEKIAKKKNIFGGQLEYVNSEGYR